MSALTCQWGDGGPLPQRGAAPACTGGSGGDGGSDGDGMVRWGWWGDRDGGGEGDGGGDGGVMGMVMGMVVMEMV